ncbi:triose-phosphate isomerase family protein [Sinomonas sp. P47F7]|uniref:triose-phosphate isomerase family protein n=1 Tax=Sinomonas sp. P47F7 TaxID=3410987 RepID=UPI003BF4DA6A
MSRPAETRPQAVRPQAVLGVSLKMYFGYEQTLDWCRSVARIAADHPAVQDGTVELFVLPTAPALRAARAILAPAGVGVGGQDLSWEDSGAFTGEVSGAVLAELRCGYAEVGHAERRRFFGEDDAMVAAKTAAALRNGLTPVLCVGEPERGNADDAAQWCRRELAALLTMGAIDGAAAGAPEGRVIVAYEPHWAIGAPEPASPEHVSAVAEALADALAGMPGREGSRVIYGGSAGPGLLGRLSPAVDGLFLGRFAHDPAAFAAVLDEAAARVGAGLAHEGARQ